MSEKQSLKLHPKREGGRGSMFIPTTTKEMRSKVTGKDLGVFIKQALVGTLALEDDGPQRSVALIYKEVGLGFVDKYISNWQTLKETGIPTVPSMRKIDDGCVVMSDMSRDASEFYGKEYWYNFLFSNRQQRVESLSAVDVLFANIDPGELREEISRISDLASDNRIQLPHDDPVDLRVSPSGFWEVLVLDLSGMRVLPEDAHESKLQWLKEYNRKLVSEATRDILGTQLQLRQLLRETGHLP